MNARTDVLSTGLHKIRHARENAAFSYRCSFSGRKTRQRQEHHTEDIVNELMKDMAFRPDQKFLGYWYDHSGEDFDWFIEGADYEVLPTTAANQTTDNPNYIRPKCFPALEGYDWKEEYYPYFHGTITTNPNMQWACQAAQDAAAATGNVETMFGTWGEQLIKDESGAIADIYAELISERAMAQPRALRLDNSLPERTHSAVRKTPANAILRLFRAYLQKTPSPLPWTASLLFWGSRRPIRSARLPKHDSTTPKTIKFQYKTSPAMQTCTAELVLGRA